MGEEGSHRQKLFQGAAFITFGIGFELVFSFFAKVAVAKYLGTADFGAFSIGFALVTVATIVSTIGLQDGVARTIPRSESKSDETNTILTGVLVSLLVSVAIMVIIYLFADLVAMHLSQEGNLSRVIRISTYAIPLLVVSRVAVGVGRGYKNASLKVIIINVLRPATFFAGTTAVLLFSIGSTDATYIIPVSYVPGTVIGTYYVVKKVHLPSIFQSLSFRHDLILFSAPLMISGFMRQILNRLDTFIIAIFEPATQVGIYNAVYPLSRLSNVFLAAFGFIVMPIFSSIDADSTNKDINSIYTFATKWIVVGTIPVFLGFSLLPTEMISFIFGREYVPGNLTLAILTVGFFVHTILGPNSNALVALGKSKIIFVFTAVSAIINVVLNLILIPLYGIVGAAVATAISYTVLNVLNSAELYRSEHVLPVDYDMGFLIVCSTFIAIVVTNGISRLTIPPLPALIAFGLIFGPLYLILLVVTGSLTHEDVSELIALIKSNN
ncbi:flippase [Halosimplex salinum]|uniref:flippase n=1 Tax=Halosimplex salinum TaxID=1710538 RepID=UPI000F48AFA0|nr:flippase [Halosimplex salinum]